MVLTRLRVDQFDVGIAALPERPLAAFEPGYVEVGLLQLTDGHSPNLGEGVEVTAAVWWGLGQDAADAGGGTEE